MGGSSASMSQSTTMQNQEPPVVFDKERASSYDKRLTKTAPLFEALHLLIRVLLSDLPADARILCVGAGTGAELINLALHFPQWQFTAVDPAAPMLDICRRRAEEEGVAARCTFHEGYLASLPEAEGFDAATCLLVSHSFMQTEERRRFFQEIAVRLRPGGYLVSSDLASDMSSAAYQSLLAVWLRMLRLSDIPEAEVEKFHAAYGRDAAILPPAEVASLIGSSGFDAPTLFFQTLLIHAWYARKEALAKSSRG